MSEFVPSITHEKVVLVAVSTQQVSTEKTQEYLDELAFLVDTAGGIPIKTFIQNLPYSDPKLYVGSGKLNEIKEFIEENEVPVLVFDDELSPSQTRNIEKVISNCRVIDRTRLILDIFFIKAIDNFSFSIIVTIDIILY